MICEVISGVGVMAAILYPIYMCPCGFVISHWQFSSIQTPSVFRQAAAGYMASYMARAKFLCVRYIV